MKTPAEIATNINAKVGIINAESSAASAKYGGLMFIGGGFPAKIGLPHRWEGSCDYDHFLVGFDGAEMAVRAILEMVEKLAAMCHMKVDSLVRIVLTPRALTAVYSKKVMLQYILKIFPDLPSVFRSYDKPLCKLAIVGNELFCPPEASYLPINKYLVLPVIALLSCNITSSSSASHAFIQIFSLPAHHPQILLNMATNNV